MKLFRGNSAVAVLLALAFKRVVAIDLDLNDPASIKTAAATIAFDMMTYYQGNISGNDNWQGSPGVLPLPFATGGYYWWEAGGMWGAMIDYWYYTGDTSYNDVISQGIVFQSNAPANNFMVQNQTLAMGNDDQGFWGMTAMTAAETNFPAPPSDSGIPGWLALAQGVFNTEVSRWDNTSCAGGLRWQVNEAESGYTYKNSISNGVMFNIASRLALYTGNSTYYNWAKTVYDWEARIGLVDEDNWFVYDGSDDRINCTQIDHDQWTYNAGIYLFGMANMYNYTSGLDSSDPSSADAAQWKSRLTGFTTIGLNFFFNNGIMFEICEASNNCGLNDKKSFKAYLSRWMAATTKIAPFTYDTLKPLLESSARAAAQQCSGGVNSIGTGAGRQCGLKWTQTTTYDGDTGVGQQMAALEVIQGNLIAQVADTVTNKTGGTSQGDAGAGSAGSSIGPDGLPPIVVTESDRVGAGFITFFTLLFVIGACWWMVSAERISDTPGSLTSERKREWGWGDLSMGARIMGRRQFTPKGGFADRDSMALEKLKMSGGSSGNMMATHSDRGSGMVYGGGAVANDSSMDVYESGIPFNSNGAGSRPGSRGMPYSPTGNGSGMLGVGNGNGSAGGSRPGSSRGFGGGGGGHHVGAAV